MIILRGTTLFDDNSSALFASINAILFNGRTRWNLYSTNRAFEPTATGRSYISAMLLPCTKRQLSEKTMSRTFFPINRFWKICFILPLFFTVVKRFKLTIFGFQQKTQNFVCFNKLNRRNKPSNRLNCQIIPIFFSVSQMKATSLFYENNIIYLMGQYQILPFGHLLICCKSSRDKGKHNHNKRNNRKNNFLHKFSSFILQSLGMYLCVFRVNDLIFNIVLFTISSIKRKIFEKVKKGIDKTEIV